MVTTPLSLYYRRGLPRKAPNALLPVFTDLANASTLVDRVGLGQLLTMLRMLARREGSFGSHKHLSIDAVVVIDNPADLADPEDQQVVAWLLDGIGSALHVGNRVVSPDEARFPVGPALRPIMVGAVPVRTLFSELSEVAYALLDRLQLTGPEAAAVLNAIPEWRALSHGADGFTGNAIDDHRSRAKPLFPRPGEHNPRFDDLTERADRGESWEDLGQDAIQLPAMARVHWYVAGRNLTPVQLTILSSIAARTHGSLDVSTPTTADPLLVRHLGYVLDVVQGYFLGRQNPQRDRDRARRQAQTLRSQGKKLEYIRAALNNQGFLTSSGEGEWSRSTVSTLLKDPRPPADQSARKS